MSGSSCTLRLKFDCCTHIITCAQIDLNSFVGAPQVSIISEAEICKCDMEKKRGRICKIWQNRAESNRSFVSVRHCSRRASLLALGGSQFSSRMPRATQVSRHIVDQTLSNIRGMSYEYHSSSHIGASSLGNQDRVTPRVRTPLIRAPTLFSTLGVKLSLYWSKTLNGVMFSVA